jgi:hypothetical protein
MVGNATQNQQAPLLQGIPDAQHFTHFLNLNGTHDDPKKG